jgi:hypothetical protein
MSVTGEFDASIPHGLKGSRAPYNCVCSKCRTAQRKYNREKAAEYRQREREAKEAKDELAAKRQQRTTARTKRSAAATESRDSDKPGKMERAVIEECAELEKARQRPTLVEAAKNLAKIVDNPKLSSIHTSTTKQLMAILSDLHGDTEAKKATGKRKSGGRLATVGNLTKVKRAQ